MYVRTRVVEKCGHCCAFFSKISSAPLIFFTFNSITMVRSIFQAINKPKWCNITGEKEIPIYEFSHKNTLNWLFFASLSNGSRRVGFPSYVGHGFTPACISYARVGYLVYV